MDDSGFDGFESFFESRNRRRIRDADLVRTRKLVAPAEIVA